MNYLNEDQNKLLAKALSPLSSIETVNSAYWLIGSIIGRKVSLLGTTQNKESLFSVYNVLKKIASDINECFVVNVDEVYNAARSEADRRWMDFFSPEIKGTNKDVIAMYREPLSGNLSGDAIDSIVADVDKVILASGITTIIHNKPAEPAPQPVAQPAPEQPTNPEPAPTPTEEPAPAE